MKNFFMNLEYQNTNTNDASILEGTYLPDVNDQHTMVTNETIGT